MSDSLPITLRPASEQLALLRRRDITPGELLDEHIAQIRRLNPQLNALVDFDADRVRSQVARLRPGPLSGLPVTIKSSIAVAGYRCETGSTIHRGFIPDTNAVLVDRLLAAGAVVLGTTNCPEFLMAYETENLLYGSTRNPWDLERTPGGSSGGESAAIAAGLSAAGLGSDSGGSVREPAHFTGICALKPTAGRFPAAGHLPPCLGPFAFLGSIGPMARTIGDVRLLFESSPARTPSTPTAPPSRFGRSRARKQSRSPSDTSKTTGLYLSPQKRAARSSRQPSLSAIRASPSNPFGPPPSKPHASFGSLSSFNAARCFTHRPSVAASKS